MGSAAAAARVGLRAALWAAEGRVVAATEVEMVVVVMAAAMAVGATVGATVEVVKAAAWVVARAEATVVAARVEA